VQYELHFISDDIVIRDYTCISFAHSDRVYEIPSLWLRNAVTSGWLNTN